MKRRSTYQPTQLARDIMVAGKTLAGAVIAIGIFYLFWVMLWALS